MRPYWVWPIASSVLTTSVAFCARERERGEGLVSRELLTIHGTPTWYKESSGLLHWWSRCRSCLYCIKLDASVAGSNICSAGITCREVKKHTKHCSVYDVGSAALAAPHVWSAILVDFISLVFAFAGQLIRSSITINIIFDLWSPQTMFPQQIIQRLSGSSLQASKFYISGRKLATTITYSWMLLPRTWLSYTFFM